MINALAVQDTLERKGMETRVMTAIPIDVRTRPTRIHNLHEIAMHPAPKDEPATLEYLMRDYVKHLEHHLKQIDARIAGR